MIKPVGYTCSIDFIYRAHEQSEPILLINANHSGPRSEVVPHKISAPSFVWHKSLKALICDIQRIHNEVVIGPHFDQRCTMDVRGRL